MIHDPGFVPSDRPRRIPQLLARNLIDTGRQARVTEVLSHRGYGQDPHTLRITNRPTAPIGQPLPSVTNLHRKEHPVYQEPQLPENVVNMLSRLVAHVNKPGSVEYGLVGEAADLVQDFFDLPTTPIASRGVVR